MDQQLRESMGRMTERIQKLDAAVSFDAKRQQTLLGIRDEILKTNPRLGLADAYRYAEWILRASDKYPSVDPLMFLSIGIVESGYNPLATSQANARGLYQIWPSTGRMLARALDWEYSDEMLFDPQKNTEMAALYLDILFTAYRDARMVLAEYNGGPLNAGYLRAGSQQAAAETKDYVLKVLDVHERLKSKFESGWTARLDLMHLDPQREGKVLAAAPPPTPAGAAGTP
jgi:soluble lytic murein transglycosylase-like protein